MKHESKETLSTAVSSHATSAQAAYKTLLVPVDARESSRRSVKVACTLAERFGAHMVGIYIHPPFNVPPELGMYGSTVPIALIEDSMDEAAQAARTIFYGVLSAGAAHSWHSRKGDPVTVAGTHAQCADLVIVNQTDPGEGGSHFPDRLLLSVNRPILVVPAFGDFDRIGNRILVCWNASAEAGRAVTDALPFLQRASKVTVLSIDARGSDTGHGAQSGADLARFLARHGVTVEVAHTVSGGQREGDIILSRAADESSDLIVMGAYGHARLREMILGGATRTILQSMTVPVLMSH
jgi:nucleotide-binding universal stress UspA family protein